MKVFLLAAGRGTRLRPLTDTCPKCLLPINGRPLLDWWFLLFQRHGVTHVLVNLHHLPHLVRETLTPWSQQFTIATFYEETLLGTAGTVLANRWFVEGEQDFFICYADNLTDVDLGKLLAFHRARRSPLTIGLFRTDTPRECGIALLNDQGLVIDFVEKPDRPSSTLANAGIYVATQALFEVIPSGRPADFGYDVLSRLVGRMYGYPLEGYLLDIGTPERYLSAQREWGRVEL